MTIGGLIGRINGWIGQIVPLLVGLALAYFIWQTIGLIRASDEKSREDAKNGMWSGVIAMFVIVSLWGIITFISQSISINPGGTFVAPQF